MTPQPLMIGGMAVTATESPGKFKVRFRHHGQVFDWPGWETMAEAQAAQWFIAGMRPLETYPAARWDRAWYDTDPFAEIIPILPPPGAKPAPATDAEATRARERKPWQRKTRKPVSD